MIYDICVIGAGASGMAAAICAGRMGVRTAVLDRMTKPGKKILVTGNGKCNLSNTALFESASPDYNTFYRGSNQGFAAEVLSGFDTEQLIHFLESIGIYTHQREGYLYPMSDQALSVRNALERAIEETGCVRIYTECCVCRIESPKTEKKDSVFIIHSENGLCIKAKSLIIAAGGCAAPKQGSDGSGYRLASMLGHAVIEPLPALTALHCKEKYIKDLAGIRCKAHIKLCAENKVLAQDTGELQLTNYGISGIPVFQVSRFASRALHDGLSVTAMIDFFPEIPHSRLQKMISDSAAVHPAFNMITVLSGLMNEKMASVMTKLILPGQLKTPACRWAQKDLSRLTDILKYHTLHITATNGFDQAQVCCGGVDTSQIDPDTMQSKITSDLYITGELLDIDGICGGFNLHWAFATGCIAGTHAAKRRLHA